MVVPALGYSRPVPGTLLYSFVDTYSTRTRLATRSTVVELVLVSDRHSSSSCTWLGTLQCKSAQKTKAMKIRKGNVKSEKNNAWRMSCNKGMMVVGMVFSSIHNQS